MNHDEIVTMLEALPNTSYKKYLSNKPATLNENMSLVLGTSTRNMVRILRKVVNGYANKLQTKALLIEDTNAQLTANQWLVDNQWKASEKKLFRAVVRDGTAYILVSYRNNKPAITLREVYDGTHGAYIFYDEGEPLFAVNLWTANKQHNLDVYYPDRIEKYKYTDEGWEKRKDVKGEKWPIDLTDNNNQPLGIPLIPFSIDDSVLADGVTQLQTDINSILLDQLAVSRTMGYPQRYIKGSSGSEIVTNIYGQVVTDRLGNPLRQQIKLGAPGSLYTLNADSELGQLDPATPDSTTLDMWIRVLSLTTDVPMFYFSDNGKDMPSGLAIMQMEAPMNHRVEEMTEMLTPSLQNMIRMMLEMNNTYGDSPLGIDTNIVIEWYPPFVETDDMIMEKEKLRVDTATKLVREGILSVEDALRYVFPDKDDNEIADMVTRTRMEKSFA